MNQKINKDQVMMIVVAKVYATLVTSLFGTYYVLKLIYEMFLQLKN